MRLPIIAIILISAALAIGSANPGYGAEERAAYPGILGDIKKALGLGRAALPETRKFLQKL